MCPHGYHHSGSMATPTLGTRDIIQIYSGITCGRVLNGELYTCKLYKLINLCNLYNLDIYIYIYNSLFTIWYRTCACTIQDVQGKKSTQIIDNFPYRLFRICIIIV